VTSQAEIDRPLPYSEGAERGILGALLIGNPESRAVVDRPTPEDFFLPQHRRIFAAVLKLAQAQKPIDLLAVHEALLQATELEEAGGIGYIAQLGDKVPRVESLELYARTIKAKAIRRRIIHASQALRGFAASPAR